MSKALSLDLRTRVLAAIAVDAQQTSLPVIGFLHSAKQRYNLPRTSRRLPFELTARR